MTNNDINKATILVVDDDQDILRLICMRLMAAGYQTLTASDGGEALLTLHMQRPDLVISDLRMPTLDGISLMESAHETNPTLPFIILTAHGSIPEAVQATQKGAFSFLAKPFDSQALLQLVADGLRISGIHKDQSIEEEDGWRQAIFTRSGNMESLLGQAKLIAGNDVSAERFPKICLNLNFLVILKVRLQELSATTQAYFKVQMAERFF